MADDPFDPWAEPLSKMVRVWHRFRWIVLIFGLIFCLGWTFIHRNDPKIINYLVNCFPVPLTIFIAFMPDLRRAHPVWRGMIVVFGIAWSFLLWRQMDLSAKQALRDQKGIVYSAVTQANSHSDAKFSQMKQQVDQTGAEIGTRLDKVETDLASSIGKVGRTAPAPVAALTFSLWSPTGTEGHPLLVDTTEQDSDGAYPVSFSVANWGSTTARSVDIWVQICSVCTFAKEPNGFEHPAGGDDHVRHKKVGDMNPGVSLEKMTVFVKAPANPLFFDLAMHYSCENCGGRVSPNQIVRLNEIPERLPKITKLSSSAYR